MMGGSNLDSHDGGIDVTFTLLQDGQSLIAMTGYPEIH